MGHCGNSEVIQAETFDALELKGSYLLAGKMTARVY